MQQFRFLIKAQMNSGLNHILVMPEKENMIPVTKSIKNLHRINCLPGIAYANSTASTMQKSWQEEALFESNATFACKRHSRYFRQLPEFKDTH